jgi:uncharacterized SAM-binding protein YcdF (DUF218 family)
VTDVDVPPPQDDMPVDVTPVDVVESDPTPAGGVVLPSKHRRLWRVLRWTGGVLGVVVLYFAGSLWFVLHVGDSDQARPVDAIVVMGAAQYDGRPSRQLAARLDHVVLLWQRGLAPMVITTGGNRPGDRFTESQASAKYLEARGVPAAAILQVGGSTSYAELVAVRDLLRVRGGQRVLLVSDPYHSLRIRLVSQELGLTAYVSPTRTSPVKGYTAFRYEVKEAFGVGVGRIIGFRHLLSLTG